MGPVLSWKLDAHARAPLAVVHAQAAQHGPALGHGDVMRAIVADQDDVVFKVAGVDLGKAAPRLQAVDDQHGHAVLEVQLARHGERPPGEERTADDQRGRQPLVGVAVAASVIVGQAR